MTASSVLCVVTNYKRPQNVVRIIDALDKQTVRPRIVVVDNNNPLTLKDGGDDLEIAMCANDQSKLIDDYWRVRENAGPPVRWAPALFRHDCEYVLFVDDDLLPGKRMVEFLLGQADGITTGLSTIGLKGRIFRRDAVSHHLQYRRANVRRNGKPSAVDITCRVHLTRMCHVRHAVRMTSELVLYANITGLGGGMAGVDDARKLASTHDDILLCMGIQDRTGCPSYIAAACDDPDCGWTELPAPHALNANPHHETDRTRLINAIERMGWRRPLAMEYTVNGK